MVFFELARGAAQEAAHAAAGDGQGQTSARHHVRDPDHLAACVDQCATRVTPDAHENHFFDDMHSFIAAMGKRFPIDLGIIVGHPAMIATGPLGGHAVETGLVIAGTDAVAADTVGAWLLGFGPQAVRHLWEAGRLGLGETRTKQMEFPAMSLKQATEEFTEAAYGERLTFEHP